MRVVNRNAPRRPAVVRAALGVLMVCVVAGCSRDEPAAPQAASAAAATEAQRAAAEAAQAAASAELAALSADELRTRASAAYAESRLYAPAGDNALEYYLALREKVPADAGPASALTDLMPMVVIATEQSRDREDFTEARRLAGLLQRADDAHPALSRLTTSIDAAATAAERRVAEAQLTAAQDVERQRQLELERTRAQQQAQEQAAQQLAAQQAAEQQAAAAQEAAAQREAAERVAAEQRAAEERAAAARAAAAAPTPAPTAAAAAPAAAATALRALSTPAPRYPPEALRAGESGEVLVEFTVNPDGSVANARVVRASPPRVFDREAVSAVRRWRFEPVSEPVTTRRSIDFNPGN